MHFQVCKGRLGFYFGHDSYRTHELTAACDELPRLRAKTLQPLYRDLTFCFSRGGRKYVVEARISSTPHPCSTGCVPAPRTAASCSQASSYFNLSASSHRVWRLRTETALSPPRSHKSSARYCVLTLALVMFRPKDSTHQSSQKVGPAQFSPTQRSVS